MDGNRIAEYLYDPIAQSSTLMREYVWMDGRAVAVVEGGVLYFIRTDHIGRPVFATDSTGTKVWEATYLPFGGVRTTVGTPISLRFPGQWYQAESGLHQNWMRDYDPTTGRYIQADPLGLVDGASVYGYALQNPMRWTDPTGTYTLNDAERSLRRRHNTGRDFSQPEIFDEWLRLERNDRNWLNELPSCPEQLPCDVDETEWTPVKDGPIPFHPGGMSEIRSLPTPGGHASQCIYDQNGNLIRDWPGAGSADRAAF